MENQRRAAIFTDFTDAQKEELIAMLPGWQVDTDRQMILNSLSKYEILFGNPPPKTLAAAGHLKWLQLQSAGVDAFIRPGVLPAGTVLTNSSGAYGQAVAEHTFAMLMTLLKKLHLYAKNNTEALWKDEGNVKAIPGLSVLVWGFGDLGQSFAKLCHAVGCRVTAVVRSQRPMPDYVHAFVLPEGIEAALADAEVLAMFLPATEETYHIVNAELLSKMRPDALLLNAGRGDAMDCMALAEALEKSILAGAGLDVTDPEPLPAEHPLWRCRTALITPHASGGFHLAATKDRVFAIAKENLRRYLAGEPLKNTYDTATHHTEK